MSAGLYDTYCDLVGDRWLECCSGHFGICIRTARVTLQLYIQCMDRLGAARARGDESAEEQIESEMDVFWEEAKYL